MLLFGKAFEPMDNQGCEMCYSVITMVFDQGLPLRDTADVYCIELTPRMQLC